MMEMKLHQVKMPKPLQEEMWRGCSSSSSSSNSSSNIVLEELAICCLPEVVSSRFVEKFICIYMVPHLEILLF